MRVRVSKRSEEESECVRVCVCACVCISKQVFVYVQKSTITEKLGRNRKEEEASHTAQKERMKKEVWNAS